jgi:hypothetical protein
MLDRERALGEEYARGGSADYAGSRWSGLFTVFSTAYGKADARACAAASREASCLMMAGHGCRAFASTSRLLRSLREPFWPRPDDADPAAARESLRREGAEVAFALETHAEATKRYMKLSASEDGFDFLSAYAEIASARYDDVVTGIKAKSGGPAIGWDGPEGEGARAARLEALRGELERSGVRNGAGNRESAVARYRYAVALTGERGSATGYEDQEVPPEDLNEALGLCEGLPEALSGAGAPGEPGPLDARRLTGRAAYLSGDVALAERVRRKALAEAKAALSSRHPAVLGLKCDLAESLLAKGDGKRALDLLSVIMSHLTVGPAASPLEAARAAVLLSNGYLSSGDPLGAAAERFKAADSLEIRYGSDHRGAVELRARGAALLSETGNYGAAAAVYGACAESAARAVGARDLRALAFADKRAATLILAGDAAAAEKVAGTTLSARRAPGGPSGKEAELGLIDTLSFLGAALRKSGDLAGARAACADACAVARAMGPGHLATAGAIEMEAAVAEDMGDMDAALALNREALAIRREVLAPDDRDTLESVRAVGRLSGQGDGNGDGWR